MSDLVEVHGLTELTRALRGPMFKEVNKELRAHSKVIALEILPLVQSAVARSGAPQATAMAATARVHSDRVPVVVLGKVNPRFVTGFRRKGDTAASTRQRRGSLARGVLAGGAGGKRSTNADEDYYHIPRDESLGVLGRALAASGPIVRKAEDAYIRAWMATLRAHGFTNAQPKGRTWPG